MDKKRTPIGDIAEVYDGPHATPKKIDNGPYFLSISSLDKGRLDLSKSANLSENDFIKWTKRVTPQKGDLLFSYETRLGEAALMPDGVRACLGRRMGLLRPKQNKVVSEYLLYAYLSPAFQQTIISNTIRGATVDRIALNELPNFEIYIPLLSEQKEVANFLQNIDSKIELNNHINAELEAMAKTLYRYWFVQFDFPISKEQAQAMGDPALEGQPYKTSGGKMVYNIILKREIPEQWEVEPLLKSCSVIDCLHSKKSDYCFEDEKCYLLQLENILDNGLLDISNRYYVSKTDYETWTSRIKIRHTDIVMTNAGRIAAFAQVPDYVECGIGRNITAIRPNSICPSYFFLSLSGLDLQKQIKTNLDHGAFFKSFNVKGIKALNLVRPNIDIEKRFESIVSPIIKKRHIAMRENQHLTQLRDWLLPMLMNGQATVK